MNDTNTVTGGYYGSKMYTEYLAPFKAVIQNDFEKVKAAYLSKLKISRDAFLSGIAGMTPQELISNAHNIAGVQLCYKKLLKANEEELNRIFIDIYG